jgi:prenyltransferase beta subunit
MLKKEIPNENKLIQWLCERATALGFTGRTNKLPDSCYSFWNSATLSLLKKQDLIETPLIIKALLHHQCSTV